MRKSLALALVALLALSQGASAATKPLVLKPITLLGSALGAEGALVSGKTIITFENIESATLDVGIAGRDLSGKTLWNALIDSGSDEIATAATVDQQGNIWIAGTSSVVATADTQTAPVNPLNLDGVVTESDTPTRGDLTTLKVWEFSSLGESKTSLSLALEFPLLVNTISVNASGISIISLSEAGSVLINSKPDGVFQKPVRLGTTKTHLDIVNRNSDGTLSIFGSSSETLSGKKVMGVEDGILMKVSSLGKIISVVRSSAPKGIRSWSSATSGNFLTGTVSSRGKSEIAITKFTSAFSPSWTMRFPGGGKSIGINATSGNYFVALQPKVLQGVAKWSPGKDQNAVLALSSKGAITALYTSSELGPVISGSYSKEAGLILLAYKRGTTEISIFNLK